MIPLRELGYVKVGMVITDVNGNEAVITDIFIPSSNAHLLMSVLPDGNDLILVLDQEYCLTTDIGWEHLDSRIKVLQQ